LTQFHVYGRVDKVFLFIWRNFMTEIATITGLYRGKGQSLSDLHTVNPDYTKKQLENALEARVKEGKIETYMHGGAVFYLLAA
jgi:hypothetical protein